MSTRPVRPTAKKHKRRRGVRQISYEKAIVVFLALYILAAIGTYFSLDSILFRPPLPTYQDDADLVRIPVGREDTIAGLYLKQWQGQVLLYSHDGGEDLGMIRPILDSIRSHGYGVLAYDYRGYGRSTGKPSEDNTYEDVAAAYAYLVEDQGVPVYKIIAYGRGLGAGPAVHLAQNNKVSGLILEGAFTSALRALIPVTIFPFDKFKNIGRIREINCPVLIMHSRDDNVVPFSHGEDLFDYAFQTKRQHWADSAGHLGIPFTGDAYWRALAGFTAALP